MSESLSEKARKISKPTAAVAGMGLALGLGWTLSSGFKGLPAEVVSSSQDVRIASSYRGFCHQISVFEGERELQLSDRDVGRGLARFGLHLKPGQHDLRLRFKSLVPGLERDYPLTVVVDEEAPSLSAGFEEAPGETRLVTTDESLTLAGHLEVGSSLFLEGVRVPTNEDGSFTHQVKLKPGWNHLLLAGVPANAQLWSRQPHGTSAHEFSSELLSAHSLSQISRTLTQSLALVAGKKSLIMFSSS